MTTTDGDFWRAVKANHQAEYLLISTPGSKLQNYSVDGETMNWTDYKKFLLASIADCDAKIAAAEPFELEQRGVT